MMDTDEIFEDALEGQEDLQLSKSLHNTFLSEKCDQVSSAITENSKEQKDKNGIKTNVSLWGFSELLRRIFGYTRCSSQSLGSADETIEVFYSREAELIRSSQQNIYIDRKPSSHYSLISKDSVDYRKNKLININEQELNDLEKEIGQMLDFTPARSINSNTSYNITKRSLSISDLREVPNKNVTVGDRIINKSIEEKCIIRKDDLQKQEVYAEPSDSYKSESRHYLGKMKSFNEQNNCGNILIVDSSKSSDSPKLSKHDSSSRPRSALDRDILQRQLKILSEKRIHANRMKVTSSTLTGNKSLEFQDMKEENKEIECGVFKNDVHISKNLKKVSDNTITNPKCSRNEKDSRNKRNYHDDHKVNQIKRVSTKKGKFHHKRKQISIIYSESSFNIDDIIPFDFDKRNFRRSSYLKENKASQASVQNTAIVENNFNQLGRINITIESKNGNNDFMNREACLNLLKNSYWRKYSEKNKVLIHAAVICLQDDQYADKVITIDNLRLRCHSNVPIGPDKEFGLHSKMKKEFCSLPVYIETIFSRSQIHRIDLDSAEGNERNGKKDEDKYVKGF